jgi:Oxidoreductase family, NAD-binding Rossmann fold
MVPEHQLDAVIVATQPNLHREQVLACIEAGVRHVLCEKSLALTGAETRRTDVPRAQGSRELPAPGSQSDELGRGIVNEPRRFRRKPDHWRRKVKYSSSRSRSATTLSRGTAAMGFRGLFGEQLAERRFGGDADIRREFIDTLQQRRDAVPDRADLA